jgi:hypothetical protein
MKPINAKFGTTEVIKLKETTSFYGDFRVASRLMGELDNHRQFSSIFSFLEPALGRRHAIAIHSLCTNGRSSIQL